MSSVLAHIKLDGGADWGLNYTNPPKGNAALQWLEDLVRKVKSGTVAANSVEIQLSSTSARHAGQFILLSSGSGALTITANGATIASHTWATSDTASATALVAALNADSDAVGLCMASNYVATVTFSSADSGDIIYLLGEQFVGGTDFTVTGTDTQDAASFISAVRSHPWLSDVVHCDQAAGVVYIGLRPGYTPPTQKLSSSDGTDLAVANGTFAASANILLWAIHPGTMAHKVNVGVTGTGMSVLDSATDFEGGAGFGEQTASSTIYVRK